MDALKKKIEVWLNRPKADDQSLLARFYFADKSLSAIANELDSFDGRTEPDRCSRLVARLRQEQDRVLCIVNKIMDDLLASEDRATRNFRVKFPEEVLQESLAGQLWFGAECLAAGSSIMHREAESNLMRPLAKAVTKSLDNVRNLLREKCLRNNTPNSSTVRLNTEDASTEKLYESLKIFDRLFAEFEFLYVSAMVQVKTKQEHEAQELVCVLFSETLQRALKSKMLTQEQVDSCDPALMFSIPRLSIVAGLMFFDSGPLDLNQPVEDMSDMFKPFRKLLVKMKELLLALSKEELKQLEKLLCTNEMSMSTDSSTEMGFEESYVNAEDFLYTSNNNAFEEASNTNHNQSPSASSLSRDSSTATLAQSIDESLVEKISSELTISRSVENITSIHRPSTLNHSKSNHFSNTIPCFSKPKSHKKEGDYILHRLFVCIAGCADQLQTNFASDLRQILKNVFLMNCSQNEVSIDVQQPSEPFIFQATEDNILTTDFTASEPIQTAEEVIADNNGNLFGHEQADHDVDENAETYTRRSYVNAAQSDTTEFSPTTSEHSSFLRPPQWVPDSDAPRCMSCEIQFNPFRRRHHCRRCGHVVCHLCSKNTAILAWDPVRLPVRVCDTCFSNLGEQ